jgi:hypothetical protein
MTGGRARAADVMRPVVSVDLLAALRATISTSRFDFASKSHRKRFSRALAVPTND